MPGRAWWIPQAGGAARPGCKRWGPHRFLPLCGAHSPFRLLLLHPLFRFRRCLLQRPKIVQISFKPDQETQEAATQVRAAQFFPAPIPSFLLPSRVTQILFSADRRCEGPGCTRQRHLCGLLEPAPGPWHRVRVIECQPEQSRTISVFSLCWRKERPAGARPELERRRRPQIPARGREPQTQWRTDRLPPPAGTRSVQPRPWVPVPLTLPVLSTLQFSVAIAPAPPPTPVTARPLCY